MAETNHEEGVNAGARGTDGPAGVDTRKKKEVQQKKKGCHVQSVDEMRITELKNALRRLNLSTTGNKAELQMRLRGARARQQRQSEAEDDEVSDDAVENESVASDSMTESDDVSSYKEAASNEEDRRKRRKDRERTTINVARRSGKGADKGGIEKPRGRTKKERASHSDQTETDDGSGSESDDDSSVERRHHRNRHRHNHFTIKDVEGSLTHFSGDDKLPIEKWIDEFEDMSALLKWNDLQKLVYGKRMLTGSAKKFISFEKRVTSWNTLKRRLIREFSVKLNSADVHSRLFKRRLRADESSRQYIYEMQEIASQGYIEKDALIQYIIDGMPDDEVSKTVLYNSRTIRELKKNFEIYDRMKERVQRKRTGKKSHAKADVRDAKGTQSKSSSKQMDKTDKRYCFHCGSAEHEVKSCPNADKGPKCFKCNQFGHIASKCSQDEKRESKTTTVNWVTSTDDKCVPVDIAGARYSALIDTGSDASLMRDDVYEKIGRPVMDRTTRTLTGLGNISIQPKGVLRLKLSLSDREYEVEVLVIPTSAMTPDVLLGRDFLCQTEVIIQKGRIEVKPTNDDVIDGQHQELSPSTVQDGRNDLEEYEGLAAISCFTVDEINVAEPYRSQIKALVAGYQPKEDVQTTVETRIILKDEEPVCSRPRRLAPKEKVILDKQIDEWLESGIIRPSNSEYASPVVIARKKDGSPRVCIDYRLINKRVVRDRFPMPLIDDRIDALVSFRVFSVIDLKNGFFHVPMNEKSRKYTAFVTPSGQYEFLKTPFGLCNSPTSFLRYVDEVFQDLIRRGVVFTYMDDIIIPGCDEKDALTKLSDTLTVAANNGLHINWKKCEFLQRRVEFLGHVIEDGSVKPSPFKVKAVRGFPQIGRAHV